MNAVINFDRSNDTLTGDRPYPTLCGNDDDGDDGLAIPNDSGVDDMWGIDGGTNVDDVCNVVDAEEDDKLTGVSPVVNM